MPPPGPDELESILGWRERAGLSHVPAGGVGLEKCLAAVAAPVRDKLAAALSMLKQRLLDAEPGTVRAVNHGGVLHVEPIRSLLTYAHDVRLGWMVVLPITDIL